MSREIKLSRGLVAIVDDEDYDWLSQWSWHARRSIIDKAGLYYATRTFWDSQKKKYGHVPMARQILPPPIGMFVDHVNGNSLDNRRCNLRLATRSQNNCNRRSRSSDPSGYKNVQTRVYKRLDGTETVTWRAYITFDKKRMRLGTFDDPMKAAVAYDMAALKYHGDFARRNFDDETLRGLCTI